MDQVQVGRFLAELRHQAGLTQEALGEKIGVTNKTVSRWENGNYMPDIDMLPLLGEVFQVSVDELLAGRRMTDAEQADESAAAAFRESVFPLEERKAYWKRKWRRDHRGLLIFLCLLVVLMLAVPLLVQRPWLSGLALPAALAAYGYQNNRMMAYVEHQLYDRVSERATKTTHG